MTKKNLKKKIDQNTDKETNNICEECVRFDESVTQNLILYGYKLCNVCRNSKIIFPI